MKTNVAISSSLGGEFNTGFWDSLDNFKLLRYLDAYGDTVFNRLQMDDLIQDLRDLRKIESNPLVDEILLLAELCKKKVHTYLVFYGD